MSQFQILFAFFANLLFIFQFTKERILKRCFIFHFKFFEFFDLSNCYSNLMLTFISRFYSNISILLFIFFILRQGDSQIIHIYIHLRYPPTCIRTKIILIIYVYSVSSFYSKYFYFLNFYPLFF